MRIGIVSMMRDPGPVLETFVKYHRNIGFTDFIILFDNPNDPDIKLARSLEGVIAIPVEHKVKESWKLLRHYDQCKDHINNTVGARQLLNMEYGLNIALEAGIDWLLHIDIDELIYFDDNNLGGHIDYLQSAGVQAAAYYNYEAVPEAVEIDDYFRQVNLFKKPIKLLQKQKIERAGVWPENRRYFNFYNNGKSMVQVMPGVFPMGAHRWTHESISLKKVIFFNPSILHYSVCGYRIFEQKYRHRGNFSDIRIDKDLRKNGAELDLDARDAFHAGNDKLARKIYQQRIMIDPATRDKLLQAGILSKFDIQHLL